MVQWCGRYSKANSFSEHQHWCSDPRDSWRPSPRLRRASITPSVHEPKLFGTSCEGPVLRARTIRLSHGIKEVFTVIICSYSRRASCPQEAIVIRALGPAKHSSATTKGSKSYALRSMRRGWCHWPCSKALMDDVLDLVTGRKIGILLLVGPACRRFLNGK